MRDLDDKVAVVTGGAQGIGRVLALALADAGVDVCVADIDPAGAAAVAAEVTAKRRRSLALQMDVRRREDFERVLADTVRELGGCQLLVNNAGVFHGGELLGSSDDEWRRVIDINVWGVIHGSRVFGRHFVAQSEGHIVNIASGAGLMATPGMTSYSTTKFAVVGFSETLRWELADQNVGVTYVCPGVVRTNIARAPGANLEHLDLDRVLRFAPAPEKLAPRVLHAIRHNQARVVFGVESHLFLALRLLPYPLVDRVGQALTRRALKAVRPRRARAAPRL